MQTIQTTLEQLETYAEQLRTEIERKKNNPYATQQVADRQRDLESTEQRIAMLKK